MSAPNSAAKKIGEYSLAESIAQPNRAALSLHKFLTANFTQPNRLEKQTQQKILLPESFRYTKEGGEQAGFLIAKTNVPQKYGTNPLNELFLVWIVTMPRPRKSEPRHEQLNIRFSAREFALACRNASISGKDIIDFGRAVMLRRPRPTRKSAPALLNLPPRMITRWHAAGLLLNDIAHRVNNADCVYLPLDLPQTIRAMRSLLRRSFPQLLTEAGTPPAYALHPDVHYHLRRCCTNLVQIADRYRALGMPPPAPLSNLIGRFRILLNNGSHDS